MFDGISYKLSTRRRPSSTCFILSVESLLIRFVRNDLSKVTTWETLAIESFGSLVLRLARNTLPGAALRRRLEVSIATTTVLIRLLLKSSLDTPAYDMMQGTGRIYSGLTWHVTSLQTNEKKGLNSTPSRFIHIITETQEINQHITDEWLSLALNFTRVSRFSYC